MSDLISYKCPNCGGDLRFSPQNGDYKCEYCGSRFTEQQLEALFGSQDLKDQEAEKPAEQEEARSEDGTVLYNCPSCGAEIVTEESTAATFCYYCHNPVILSGRLGGEFRPDYVVPFAIDRKRALEIFNGWIAQKKFVPKSFYSKDQIDKFSGVYFPYLLYSCHVTGRIDGEGRKVQRSQAGDFENITTSVYRVHRDGNLPVEHLAKNALKKANRILVEGVQPFDTKELKPFKASYLSGFMAEKRDVDKAEIAGSVEQEVKDYARNQLRASLAAYEDLRITDDTLEVTDEDWKYALMPVWTMTYKEAGTGKLYYFSMNGQSGKVIGELPVDQKALMMHAITVALPIFFVLLALSYFLL